MFLLKLGLLFGEAIDRVATSVGFGYLSVAEHEADEYDSREKYGMRVIDRLAAAGILGPKSIVAHLSMTSGGVRFKWPNFDDIVRVPREDGGMNSISPRR